MFTVKIHKRKNEDETYSLTENSVLVEEVAVYSWFDNWYEVYTKSTESNLRLSSNSTSQFDKQISSIQFGRIKELNEMDVNVEINLVSGYKKAPTFFSPIGAELKQLRQKYNLKLTIIARLSFWSLQYSFAEYCDIFHINIKNCFDQYEYEVEENETRSDPNNFTISVYIKHKFTKDSIMTNLEPYLVALENCHDETEEFLEGEIFDDNISTFFIFPEELKIPCEQYLLYFAQFLQDLGINATSNLIEEAGKVLFSVTPTDDKEALDKIREALAVYLNLPSSPIVYDESFAAMRLKAEIERLQSSQRITEMEFRVTQKALESQDKIILQQSVLLEQQAKVIEKITSKSIMIDSAENKEEFEKIYEGIEITHSKWFFELTGIKANPITAMKTVGKKLLGKEDEGKSILGLDD
jgi:hypothetical protein